MEIFYYKRLIIFLVLFLFVVVLPWWLAVPLVGFFMIYFPLYLEAVFLAFVYDSLYSSQFYFFNSWLFFATVLLLFLVFVKSFIRT